MSGAVRVAVAAFAVFGVAGKAWAEGPIGADAAVSAPDPAPGAEAGAAQWRVYMSPYTYHWQYNPDHRPVVSLGVERQRPDGWLLGGAIFRNSFGQPSTYLYGGKRWDGLFGHPQLFTEISGGLLYGYRGRFANKVPFNHNGYSPGALVELGWRLDAHSEFSVDVLGAAALMFQYAYRWP